MDNLVLAGEVYDASNVSRIFNLLDVSEATRSDYAARIDMFLAYVRCNGLGRDSFLEFKRHLAIRNDLSVSTKNKYLAVARIFLKELNRQGVLPTDITQNVKSFKQSNKHKLDGISDDEMTVIATSLHNLDSTPEAVRLKAIISLLALQGLRQIELIRLNVADLNLVRSIAYVQGKGRDDKEAIYLQPQTVEALKQYLAVHRIADGPVFISASNNSLGKRLTTRSVRQLVLDYLASIGISERNVHGFRHYFTTRLIRTYKGDLTVVMRYTRHRSLETLQAYNDAVAAKSDLPRFHDAFAQVQL